MALDTAASISLTSFRLKFSTVADVVEGRDNNFDLIRHIAAAAVIFGHSFALSPSLGMTDPIGRFVGFGYSGDFAVLAFFMISGILVTASFINSPSMARYFYARLFRIWPALIVCVFLSTFLIGPLFSNLSFAEYFHRHGTYTYFLHNTFLTSPAHFLPGVFDSNPYKAAVNGSLWTLPVEVRLYGVVAALGLLKLLRNRAIGASAAIGLVALFYGCSSFDLYFNDASARLPALLFLTGTVLYLWRDLIPIHGLITALLVGTWLAFKTTTAGQVLFFLAFIYSLLWIAAWAPLKKVRFPFDFSYGIYLYGFLVQQIVAAFSPKLTPYASLALSLPLTILAAAASWYIVEKPALRVFKARFPARRSSHA